MLRLSCVVATCVLALTIGGANATTFNVAGTLVNNPPLSTSVSIGGTITIDPLTGNVGPEDVKVPSNPPNTTGLDFTHLTSSASGGTGFWDITLNQGAPASFSLLLILPVSSLVGYAGSAINDATFFPTGLPPEGFTAICQVAGAVTTCGSLTASTPPPVPLPTALPLFATGIGALGLLGWRRKRKAQAVA
jgi:hypothetical protein